MQKTNLLEHIKQIIELSKEHGISDTFFSGAKDSLDYVCRRAKLSHMEAVFFSHFIYNADQATSIYEIGKQLKLDSLETMKYLEIVESLESKKYIYSEKNHRSKNERLLHYSVPIDIQKQTGKGKFSNKKNSGLNTEGFFNYAQSVFEQCCDNDLNYEGYREEIVGLIDNKKLPLVKKMDELDLMNEEKTLFVSLCCVYLDKEVNTFAVGDIEGLYRLGGYVNLRRLRSSLNNLDHKFYTLEILENANRDGFGDRHCFCFTKNMLDIINRELDIKTDKKDNRKGLMLFDEIKEKPMFYNDKENKKLEELASLLDDGNFRQIQDRLSTSGMRTGFACLFSGHAGTGKTESVYQIARKTGRDIMYVDIAETKSKWFSESEKMTKAIFTKYKKYVEDNVKAPILLFNEADAVFSKRRQLGDSRNGPGQTENAIQNIILQEMEDLKGILICTTNLTNNFDKAFERRFLYKIEFEKPSADVRHKIWKSMIPDFGDEDAKVLSASFELSGGQIENIVRKRFVDIVLKGNPPTLDAMIELCNDEFLAKESPRRVGFGT